MDRNSITRRGLIRSAAAMPLAAAAGSAANSAVTVGIIGLGGRGSSHARHLASMPQARLVSVAEISDASIERAREKVSLDGVKLYKDLNEVLAGDVDALIIATPV